jgi:hypothetical protein
MVDRRALGSAIRPAVSCGLQSASCDAPVERNYTGGSSQCGGVREIRVENERVKQQKLKR